MGYRPSQSVRLFRNHPENRYSGEVHQSIRPSILDRGGRIGTADIPIHHYGWLREKRFPSKINQYFALSKRKVKSQPKNFRAWIELGLLQLNSGDQIRAMESFHKAQSLEQGSSSAFFLGYLLIETGKHNEGIGYLKEAIRKNPEDNATDFDHADAYEEIGQAYEKLGYPKKAEKSYRLALFSRPDSPVASNNLAGLFSQRGALKEADEILEKLLVRYPRLDMVWTTFGSNKLRYGDLKRARTAFRTALNINPGNIPARKNLSLSITKRKSSIPRIKILDLSRSLRDAKTKNRLLIYPYAG
jgi:tetratricopeptide (TPR) repeat protein